MAAVYDTAQMRRVYDRRFQAENYRILAEDGPLRAVSFDRRILFHIKFSKFVTISFYILIMKIYSSKRRYEIK